LPSPVFISEIFALVQHHAADQLHVEVAHLHRAPARLAHHRKGLGQNLVQRRPFRPALISSASVMPSSFAAIRALNSAVLAFSSSSESFLISGSIALI
jgi:hypothetical protein